jgi:hypothetical protein
VVRIRSTSTGPYSPLVTVFQPIFEALDATGARYVVVGGVAVVLQGHARFTADLDIALDLSPDAVRAAVDALGALGLHPRAPVDPSGLADPGTRRRWVEDQGMTVFSMVDPDDPFRSVDIFVDEPIAFEELFARADPVVIGRLTVRVASIPDLIRLKRIAGRDQDVADIAALEAIDDQRGSAGDG